MAQRTWLVTQRQLGNSLRKLGAGLRVQRTADDPAGMAVAVRLRAGIRSYGQAERNANDGISMVQLAEGAMGRQHELLRRLRTLAVQGANGALSDGERGFIDAERGELVSEIDRIAARRSSWARSSCSPRAGLSKGYLGINVEDADHKGSDWTLYQCVYTRI